MSNTNQSDEAWQGAGMILPGDGHARVPRFGRGLAGGETLLNSLLGLLPDGILLTDPRRLQVRRTNPALCRMLGVSAERLCATGLPSFLADPQDASLLHLRTAIQNGAGFGPRQIDLRRSDGTRLPVAISADPVRGASGAVLAWIRVVPAAAEDHGDDADGSYADTLTGLGNRKGFLSRLHAEIEAARAPGRVGAVILLDLDGTGMVNSGHGRAAGDAFLALQARRLRSALGEGGYAARLGGDEFAAILSDVGTPRGAKVGALDISAALSADVAIDGVTIAGGVSIGVSLFPRDSDDPGQLLLNADAALYASQRAGGGVVTFHKPSMGALHPVTARDRTRSDLARAQNNGELSLNFQPIVDLHSGETLLMEALLRWRQRGAGQLAPEEFMRLAESNSAIGTLRRFSIDEALRQRAGWESRIGPIGVSVNISPGQIASDAALEWILGRVRDMPAPAALVLEVTETTRFREDAQFERLAKLRAAGVRIAIDDFGTGYSTLDHLARIPADFLKLDRSFTAGVGDETYRRLLRASISLGKQFGMRIVAEGIETRSQAEALRDLGCDMGQGYHFGAPTEVARTGNPQ